MVRFRSRTLVLITALCGLMFARQAGACPFCSAVSQTFSEEIQSMDVVAIVQLEHAALITNLNTSDPAAEVPKSRFRITRVIKGKEFVKTGGTFETIYFGEARKDGNYLAMATDAPNLTWSTPLVLSPRAQDYLTKLKELPDSAKRLEFFQEYLEDPDEMLARDAYDEFAKAPYADVIELKEKMDRGRLLKFIQDPQVPSNRRRLYFTMLGVCGTEQDAELLKRLMVAEDRKQRAGLDALLACYMILKKAEGLDRVDELFLKQPEAEYADTYAAIMAIRFHGSEVDVIPRSRLVQSLRLMLNRPELADLVIPDLARWEDWEVMPRLVKLFIEADENSSWVRVPVINFLRACPLPEAKRHIEELKEIDADAVKRAMTFFPLGTPTSSDETDAAGDEPSSEAKPDVEASGQRRPVNNARLVGSRAEEDAFSVGQPVAEASRKVPVDGVRATDGVEAVTPTVRRRPAREGPLASMPVAPRTLDQAELLASGGVNRWFLLAVTFGSGGVLFVAMRSVLGYGRKPASSASQ